jgi:hypothetical protein
MNMEFYTDSLYGARGDALRSGGTVSTLDFHQSFTSYNPACLAYQQYPSVSMSFIPSGFLSTDSIGKIVGFDIDKTLTDTMNNTLEDAVKDVSKTAGVDPKFESASASAGQAPGITGFEWMVPFARNNAGYGVAREERSMFKVNMLINGFFASANLTDDTEPLVDLTLYMGGDLMANIDARSVVTSIGLGRKMTSQWAMGVAIDRYESVITGSGAFAAGGLIHDNSVIGVPDQVFGDAGDGSDSLDGYGSADLRAEAWALRVGSSFHFGNDQAEVGVDFAINPELRYRGEIDVAYHKFPDPIPTPDILDPVIDNTELMTVDTPGSVRMKIPSFGRVTLAWKPGIVIAFNYTRYFDPMYIKLDNSRYYMDLKDALRLGFNFGGFQMGGGVMFTKSGAEVEKDGVVTKSHAWFTVPVASLGFVFPLGTYLDCEAVMLALPLPIAKCAVTYKF